MSFPSKGAGGWGGTFVLTALLQQLHIHRERKEKKEKKKKKQSKHTLRGRFFLSLAEHLLVMEKHQLRNAVTRSFPAKNSASGCRSLGDLRATETLSHRGRA